MIDWLHFLFSIEMEKTLNWSRPTKMRRQYWYILFFVIWCFASGWWYLFGLKGLKTDPKLFSPQTTSISIIEILVMLLIACLIGFAIAWSIRSEVIDDQQELKEKLLSDNSAFFKI